MSPASAAPGTPAVDDTFVLVARGAICSGESLALVGYAALMFYLSERAGRK